MTTENKTIIRRTGTHNQLSQTGQLANGQLGIATDTKCIIARTYTGDLIEFKNKTALEVDHYLKADVYTKAEVSALLSSQSSGSGGLLIGAFQGENVQANQFFKYQGVSCQFTGLVIPENGALKHVAFHGSQAIGSFHIVNHKNGLSSVFQAQVSDGSLQDVNIPVAKGDVLAIRADGFNGTFSHLTVQIFINL